MAWLRLKWPLELELMLDPEPDAELLEHELPDVTGEGGEGGAAVPYVWRMA